MNIILRFATVDVGSVVEAFQSDGTWFGKFFPTPAIPNVSATELRVRSFIAFCQDWHLRLASGIEPSVTEFDSFQDLTASGLWAFVASGGEIQAIAEAPVFVDAEVSWRIASPTQQEQWVSGGVA
jgi:hypothetical protein